VIPVWKRLGGDCHPNRDTASAIESAGFEIETCQRVMFTPSFLCAPAAPRIIGRTARRPAVARVRIHTRPPEAEPASVTRARYAGCHDFSMASAAGGTHTLVLYRSSHRADAALRAVCERANDAASRVTVVVLARQEDPRNGCCDTRSVLWNEVCRDLASEHLTRAVRAVGDPAGVEFELFTALDRQVVDAIAREALTRGADEILLADPRKSGLAGVERRRLRRRSPVPVRA
jgi:hypothetical protein